MSKIGKQLIKIPSGVEVSVDNDLFLAKSKNGSLSMKIPSGLIVKINDFKLEVLKKGNGKDLNKMWGLVRSKIANMIDGVNNRFTKTLELIGVGFKASYEKNLLTLDVGFTNKIQLDIPSGIEILINKNIISVTGIDKELVGQVAADIRAVKKPEPYKGSGIRYQGEIIKKKAGKKAVSSK